MRMRILGAIFLVLVIAGTCQAGSAIGLVDAIAVAERESAAAKLADIALEEARTAYDEARASDLLRPSVIAVQQAENAWQIARANRELARQDLAMQVEQAYYDVLRTQMALDLAEKAVSQSQSQLASTRIRHGQGLLSDVDLYAAESQLATSEADLNRARANLANARMQFNRALGRGLEAPVTLLDEFAYTPVPVDLTEALKRASEVRLEVKRARNAVALREKELQVTDQPYSAPIAIRKSRQAVERARVELAERAADVGLEVQRSYQIVKEGEARIPILQKNLVRAKESLRIVDARFNVGLVTTTDLIDAQKAAVQAENQLVQAVFDYNVALGRFFRSAGYPLSERR